MAWDDTVQARLVAYCRIDDPSEEDLEVLKGLYDAAVAYLAQAGVAEPEADGPRRAQYDLAVNFMVLRDYDLREAEVSGTVTDNPAFRRLITQLKLTEPVPSSQEEG